MRFNGAGHRRPDDQQERRAYPRIEELSMDIAAARRELGLTQAQAAAHLGVARSTLAGWERGAGTPTPEQVAALVSGGEAPAPRGRGRQRAQDASPRLVPCPVRVTAEAAAIARERGSAWLSALVEGAA